MFQIKAGGGAGSFNYSAYINRRNNAVEVQTTPVYVPWDLRFDCERLIPWSKREAGTLHVLNRKDKYTQPGGFKRRQWNMPLPYVRVVRRATITGSYWRFSGPYSGQALISGAERGGGFLASDVGKMYWGDQNAGGIPLVSINMRNRVTTELLVKLSNQDYNLGNALAESKKTINMIAGRTIQVLSAFRLVRQGRFGKAAKVLGISGPRKAGMTPAQIWLEYHYGWKPYVSDIYAAVKKLETGFRTEGQIIRVARQVKEVSISRGAGLRECQGSSTLTCKAIAYWKVRDQTVAMLQQSGLINPAAVAWEVVPFSFVIDWFLPIGSYLQAVTADVGLDFIGGCYVETVKSQYTTQTGDNPSPGQGIARDSRRITCDQFGMVRSTMSAPPKAGLYVRSPFSSIRVGHALALTAAIAAGK